MILSNVGIRKAVADGDLELTPFDDRLLKRNSYLLRLHSRYRRIDGDAVVDTADPASMAAAAGEAEEGESVLVTPNSLLLGCTLERIGLSAGFVGVLSGISNIARLGVMVHCASQLVNAGFARTHPSRLVFELSTMGHRQVRLYAGTPICHLVFARLDSPGTFAEQSGRTGQDGPDPSRLLQQFGHFYGAGTP